MTEETYQEAKRLKEVFIKIDEFNKDLQKVYNNVKNDNIDKSKLLVCLENYSNVLSGLRTINQEAFNKL